MDREQAGSARRNGFTLRELEVLRAVISEGKTTAAAHRLGISQPAVSRALAQLEERFGQPLFRRTGNRLQPTSEGLALNEEIEPIFTTLARLRTADINKSNPKRLRIAAPPTLSHRLMSWLSGSFLKHNPGTTIHLEIGMSNNAVAAVADDNADLGISDGFIRHDGLTVHPFRHAVAHAAIPAGHRLADKVEITPEDLADEPFIALTRRFHQRNVYDRIFTERGIQRDIKAETATSIAICEMVREGVGIGLVNPFPVCLRPYEGIVFRRFSPRVDYVTKFFVPAGPVTPIAQRFIEYARRTVPADAYSHPA
ncbi:LysR family transcriptional regulator [Stappia taiwanensis]|uniref:LysR family transcriptional regulator n=1 Tax=Stappia taiwanensis TaxID=992267 RepID=A0A838XHI6_9HYPH|nr:LysR substrate-binding domain-containing protein [Stappia taiwanensis]MBA4610859.1 LysR family transcriptional regulator [Stappia taiwanensis]GGE95295.1 LysR family transcriptional regulator [Stappia taiwanensis]